MREMPGTSHPGQGDVAIATLSMLFAAVTNT
jgi:hypothetical protein